MFNIYDLFESVGILVDAKLKELLLDKTLLATVTNIDNKEQGLYTVSYNNTTFSANGADPTLVVGDLVYVGIPQGEYANAYIISKKINSMLSQNATAINPLQAFIKELEITSATMEPYQIKKGKKPILWSNGVNYYHLSNKQGFTKLGIRASINTNCIEHIAEGYGIRIEIKSKIVKNEQSIVYSNSLVCDIAQKIGVYNIDTVGNTIVEELFDISDIEGIEEIRAYVYCDKDLTAQDQIVLTDLHVYLGSLASDYNSEGLLLYCEDNAEYSKNNNIEKIIYAKWIYYEDNQYNIVTHWNQNAFPNNANIKWYCNNEELHTSSSNPFEIITNPFNIYKENETYSAKIIYDSITEETPKQYTADLVFVNTTNISERAIFKRDESVCLSAPIIRYDNIYNPDGKIADFGLLKNKSNTLLSFNISPYTNNFTLDDILIKNVIKIPKADTNLIIEEANSFVKIVEGDSSYVSYVKEVTSLSELSLLPYSFFDYYTPNKIQNTIICELYAYDRNNQQNIVDQMAYNLEIKFNKTGVCKTDYVLQVSFTDEKGERVSSIKAKNGILYATAHLYDFEGKEKEIATPIGWSWYQRKERQLNDLIEINPLGNNQCVIRSLLDGYIENHDYSYVLQATYSTYKDNGVYTQVLSYTPIGINMSYIQTGENNVLYIVDYLDGASMVTYNSAGGEPSFYQTPYELVDLQGDIIENIIIPYVNSQPVYAYDGKYCAIVNNCLHPPLIFTKGIETSTVLYVYDLYNTLMWIQPIMLFQSKSFSSILNDWNGSSIVINDDEAQGQYLLTPSLGTGKINEKHEFSGVVLGDASVIIEDETIVDNMTGIYGFQNNVQTYGLREDGTAFFGATGSGRISIDGRDGLIYSGNFNPLISDHETYHTIVDHTHNDLSSIVSSVDKYQDNMWSISYTPQCHMLYEDFGTTERSYIIVDTIHFNSSLYTNNDKIATFVDYKNFVLQQDGPMPPVLVYTRADEHTQDSGQVVQDTKRWLIWSDSYLYSHDYGSTYWQTNKMLYMLDLSSLEKKGNETIIGYMSYYNKDNHLVTTTMPNDAPDFLIDVEWNTSLYPDHEIMIFLPYGPVQFPQCTGGIQIKTNHGNVIGTATTLLGAMEMFRNYCQLYLNGTKNEDYQVESRINSRIRDINVTANNTKCTQYCFSQSSDLGFQYKVGLRKTDTLQELPLQVSTFFQDAMTTKTIASLKTQDGYLDIQDLGAGAGTFIDLTQGHIIASDFFTQKRLQDNNLITTDFTIRNSGYNRLDGISSLPAIDGQHEYDLKIGACERKNEIKIETPIENATMRVFIDPDKAVRLNPNGIELICEDESNIEQHCFTELDSELQCGPSQLIYQKSGGKHTIRYAFDQLYPYMFCVDDIITPGKEEYNLIGYMHDDPYLWKTFSTIMSTLSFNQVSSSYYDSLILSYIDSFLNLDIFRINKYHFQINLKKLYQAYNNEPFIVTDVAFNIFGKKQIYSLENISQEPWVDLFDINSLINKDDYSALGDSIAFASLSTGWYHSEESFNQLQKISELLTYFYFDSCTYTANSLIGTVSDSADIYWNNSGVSLTGKPIVQIDNSTRLDQVFKWEGNYFSGFRVGSLYTKTYFCNNFPIIKSLKAFSFAPQWFDYPLPPTDIDNTTGSLDVVSGLYQECVYYTICTGEGDNSPSAMFLPMTLSSLNYQNNYIYFSPNGLITRKTQMYIDNHSFSSMKPNNFLDLFNTYYYLLANGDLYVKNIWTENLQIKDGKIGWLRVENHVFVYVINGMIVGSINYQGWENVPSKPDALTDPLTLFYKDIPDAYGKKPSDIDHAEAIKWLAGTRNLILNDIDWSDIYDGTKYPQRKESL